MPHAQTKTPHNITPSCTTPGLKEKLFDVKVPRRCPSHAFWYKSFPRLGKVYTLIHRHPEFEICYCPRESGHYFINGHDYRIEPGDIFIVNANEFHQPILDSLENNGAEVIYFNPEFLGADSSVQTWLSDFLYASQFRNNRIGKHVQIAALFQELKNAFESDKTNWAELCRGILSHILALVHDSLCHRSRDSHQLLNAKKPILYPVIKYIKSNLSGSIENAELYRISGLSKSQFCKNFKETFNMPVSQFILKERMNRARALLRSSEISITDICYTCGFNSLSYFNRSFKQETMQSPRDFRKKLIETISVNSSNS